MPYYLHAYIRDTATGKEKSLDAKDSRGILNAKPSRAASAAGDAKIPAKAIKHGLSKEVIKGEIKKILQSFPLPQAPKKETDLKQEISDLLKWKALLEIEGKSTAGLRNAFDKLVVLSASKKEANLKKKADAKDKIEDKFIVNKKEFLENIKYDNIESEISSRKSKLSPVESKLLVSFIPFENGEVCFIHNGGKGGALPRKDQWLRKNEKDKIERLGKDIGVKRRKVVAWDLLCHLDDFLGEVSYRVTSDLAGKQAIEAIVPLVESAATAEKAPPSAMGASVTVPTGAAAKEENKEVLANLKRVSILRRKADYLQDQAEREKSEYTFSGTDSKGWSSVFKYFELAVGSPFCKADKAKAIPEVIEHFFEKRPNGDIHPVETIPAVWIPNEFLGYFHEEPRSINYIEKDGYFWRQKEFSVGKDKPDSCVYTIVDEDIVPYIYVSQAATSPGGGGGMRSDNPWDAEYHWLAKDDDARLLGLSLGLDSKRRIEGSPDDKKYLEAPLPAGTESKTAIPNGMDSEIRYWKKFPDVPLNGKKNKPRESKPLQRAETKIVRQDVKKLYTKKQKGGWTNGRKDARPIKGAVDDRDSAGAVMREALKNLGVFPEATLSGATAFAEMAVSNGETAKEWFDFSARVAPFNKSGATGEALKVETEKLQKMLRTEQEWCHLIGHGDGGEEFFENFISGSKHCNTEQLAIEQGSVPGG